MKALTNERWQEIREIANAEPPHHAYLNSQPPAMKALRDALQQHDHLFAQIKLLADYIMSERLDDPAWSMGESACAMAVEIMRREANEIAMKSIDNSLLKIRIVELEPFGDKLDNANP